MKLPTNSKNFVRIVQAIHPCVGIDIPKLRIVFSFYVPTTNLRTDGVKFQSLKTPAGICPGECGHPVANNRVAF